jgi:hypothetical protein
LASETGIVAGIVKGCPAIIRLMRDQARLEAIVRASPDFMSWLRGASECCPAVWAIGAGAVRNLVWDHLTGRHNPPADVDVVFFHGADQEAVEDCLRARLPQVPWQAKDQALVHTWYERVFGHPVEALTSLEDAVATWPEYCTCVAVRLRPEGSLDVLAPYGLEDLFSLVLRRNPRRVTQEMFEQRLRSKRFAERWPELTIRCE